MRNIFWPTQILEASYSCSSAELHLLTVVLVGAARVSGPMYQRGGGGGGWNMSNCTDRPVE